MKTKEEILNDCLISGGKFMQVRNVETMIWKAAKEGSIKDKPVVIDQYGSVNIEQHFVDKYNDFDEWYKNNFNNC